MGYAQVAGLPPEYGLYGSLWPVLVFALLTTSGQFVFGVDAAPAALAGGMIAQIGMAHGSEEALGAVPVITLVTAGWLFLFFLFRMGRLTVYISAPVMGGFISGIATTIILMQVSKLFGGAAGTGEVFELLAHIYIQLGKFNLPSFVMGIATVALVVLFRRLWPRFPMSALLLVLGGVLGAKTDLSALGIRHLSEVGPGLPHLKSIDLTVLINEPEDVIMGSFTIAMVIVSTTLLTQRKYALKHDYRMDNNREILAFCATNLTGALLGTCPLNGSASRSALADQYGAKSRLMGITAFVTMLLLLLFCTDYIVYLPVPVLTGIVIAALMGIVDVSQAIRLYRTEREEFVIFMAAFCGVLVMGTVYGVLIGTMLSFLTVIKRASLPDRAFLGIVPGRRGYHSLKKNINGHAVDGAVIYRFSGALFFANIDVFQADIEDAIDEKTRVVIVEASGIVSVDITAAERLVLLYEKLRNRGIAFYLAEHVETLNVQLMKRGAAVLLEKDAVMPDVSMALRAVYERGENTGTDNAGEGPAALRQAAPFRGV
jgi:MFS superfamily sulfate permease-like transporter